MMEEPTSMSSNMSSEKWRTIECFWTHFTLPHSTFFFCCCWWRNTDVECVCQRLKRWSTFVVCRWWWCKDLVNHKWHDSIWWRRRRWCQKLSGRSSVFVWVMSEWTLYYVINHLIYVCGVYRGRLFSSSLSFSFSLLVVFNIYVIKARHSLHHSYAIDVLINQSDKHHAISQSSVIDTCSLCLFSPSYSSTHKHLSFHRFPRSSEIWHRLSRNN